MKLLLVLISYLLTTSLASGADSSALSSAISSLPSCALICLTSSLPNSSCSATDIACQCSDANLSAQVESCVIKSCTIREALSMTTSGFSAFWLVLLTFWKATKNTTLSLCGIQPRDHSHVIGALGIVGGALALTAVLLRTISRFMSLGGGFWWDDWTIIFTGVLIVPFSALCYIASESRLGKDIWAIPLEDIMIFFHQFYFAEVLYAALMPITKVSILFFYLRIFPGITFRRITWCLIVFCILTTITFVCVNTFQCTPISHFWKQWDGEPGRCIGPSGPAWSVSVIGIVVDFLMLSLPLNEIRQLNLHWRKKISVGLMFSVGCFVTVVSILRLQSLVHFRKTTNPTYDYYSIGYWSIVEVDIGIICACMPSIRVLLAFFFPRIIGTSYDNTTNHLTGQPRTGVGLSRSGTGGIHNTDSYSVEYSIKQNRDGSKFVQLVDMEVATSSRSQISTEERVAG